MRIFGFTITRTSKKKQDERELEIFEKCVDAMDKVTSAAKRIVKATPNIHTVQNLGEAQEHLESLIDIYNRNKFSRPSNNFTLVSLIQEMRDIYVNYSTSVVQRSRILSELKRVNNLSDNEYDIYGETFNNHLKITSERALKTIESNISISAKEYFISLDSIRFTITYDITRIATGVDIVKQYYDTKKYTIPEKGILYTLRFKKLSRDEINEQLKNIKEEEKK